MKKSLRETILLVGVLPLLVCGLLLLAGAGIFSFLAAYLVLVIGERVVKYRKEQVQPSLHQPQSSLDLVEMEVGMKFRDKSCDLRVIN